MSDQAIQYQPLSQATSSDEDDALQSDRDDPLHIRPAGKKEAIPLRKLGSPVSRSGAPRDGIVRPRRQTRRNFIIVVLLVCVLVGGAVGVAAWAISFRGDAQQGVNNVQHTHPTAYADWTLFFNQSGKERRRSRLLLVYWLLVLLRVYTFSLPDKQAYRIRPY